MGVVKRPRKSKKEIGKRRENAAFVVSSGPSPGWGSASSKKSSSLSRFHSSSISTTQWLWERRGSLQQSLAVVSLPPPPTLSLASICAHIDEVSPGHAHFSRAPRPPNILDYHLACVRSAKRSYGVFVGQAGTRLEANEGDCNLMMIFHRIPKPADLLIKASSASEFAHYLVIIAENIPSREKELGCKLKHRLSGRTRGALKRGLWKVTCGKVRSASLL
ncbi:unnamed protein product [Caenorhabditis auriculariae]|uniref:Uncharacterized protein n=1 Tax=Caenorhabditis auriculariae TaxID=2777116 RepID=A0A8S1HL46_9PELO|nr:unnamed protein product [Caenorhabditis auriculariae]